MKFKTSLLVLFFPFFLIAQSKRIMGKVFCKDRIYQEASTVTPIHQIGVHTYDIYLLKSNRHGEKGSLKWTSGISTFDFVLSEGELKEYSYLEIKDKKYSKLIKIDTLREAFQIHVLEYVLYSAKPVIYLYPTTPQTVEIKHTFNGKILNTYPEYKDSWKVKAMPNGTLTDLNDQRKHNYLFWDGECSFPKEHYNYTSGFIVKKENYITFLQEKLAFIGLNYTEANDFISYWLPSLSKHESNFIYFQINNNLGNSSFLKVKPQPQSEIRIFMEFYDAANEKRIFPEQQLPKLSRNGFTLVEWGGAEIPKTKKEEN